MHMQTIREDHHHHETKYLFDFFKNLHNQEGEARGQNSPVPGTLNAN